MFLTFLGEKPYKTLPKAGKYLFNHILPLKQQIFAISAILGGVTDPQQRHNPINTSNKHKLKECVRRVY